MARAIHKLTARQIDTITKPGRYSDGGGLYLVVSDAARRKWVFIYTRDGVRKERGLGAAGKGGLPLAKAREAAQAAREHVAAGVDPKDAREAAKAEAAKTARKIPTFGEAADDLIRSIEAEWRNAKHRDQWRMTLQKYAAPLRNMPVDKIGTEDVLRVLKPLWATKPETASRLRGRIERVLDAAKALGHRSGENPALWRGHLANLLPRRRKLTRGHHAALAFSDVPAFVARLRENGSMAARTLEFTILTAARSGEAYGARWREIDLDAMVWTIPAARMKAAREHRVPLSPRAAELLKELKPLRHPDESEGFVFPGRKAGRPQSVMAMEMLLRRMEAGDVTVHGFRSSFRDWAGECTHFPREVAEAALAHVVGDETERAYRRGDALEKRRALMDAWAGYCYPPTADNIIPLPRSA